MGKSITVVAGAVLAALLVGGCGAQGGQPDQTGSPEQSTGGTTDTPQSTAWPTPSVTTTEPSQQTDPTRQDAADVTVDDLLTAVSPDACRPSTRMIDGTVPLTTIDHVEYEPGHPWSPVYLDMAGLGYRQALAVFACGGANFIPNYLMLTGSGGELLGSVALSDYTDTAHGDVRSLEVTGDSVHVTWVASESAGANPVDRSGTVSFQDGRLVYTED
ncbi:hypothetical protein [Propionibacterium australiense]|nr:hypothetical protein [Propionibacterium australiense]RLP09511.1 hypothetical protein D9T14_07055 [Propionibacterium australiense]RLP09910.1 hypothetical protein D7U36_06980 [Propionibacterium australiense]